MVVNNLIYRYKNYRKQGYLNYPLSFKSKYAFIGVGNHSISNLYPVIDYLGVPLKYIGTGSEKNAEKMAARYKDCYGTNNLDLIANDLEIEGVFICSDPAIHYDLTKKFLGANKSVFVEKPPCSNMKELEELSSLVKASKKHCLVGLQKRYSSIYSILKKKLKNVNTYYFKFLTGAYPEGDEILDLFIHPLDVIGFLFGQTESRLIKIIRNGNNLTVFLIISHKDGTTGNVELSTNYTWNNAKEDLSVNTTEGIYISDGSFLLKYIAKSPSLIGIPLEKVFSLKQKEEILFKNTGFVPTGKFNQVYTQGYYGEIKTFTDLVEGRKVKNLTSPDSIKTTYELIEEIKQKLD